MRRALILLMLAALPGAGWVVVDRIAAIVGKHAIKTSDVERDLRLTGFLNRQSLDLGAAARKQALERLIDQQIIRVEIASGGFSRASESNAEAVVRQLQRDRFAGSPARLDAELERYGVTGAELRDQLLWQLTVLRFIDQKFRPGVSVSDDDVRDYYNHHIDALRREHPGNSGFEAVQNEIRNTLEGEAVNQEFEDWVAQARQRAGIEYRGGTTVTGVTK